MDPQLYCECGLNNVRQMDCVTTPLWPRNSRINIKIQNENYISLTNNPMDKWSQDQRKSIKYLKVGLDFIWGRRKEKKRGEVGMA